jgi:predicted flap endonuclease-1-like 5' DNA nuclease
VQPSGGAIVWNYLNNLQPVNKKLSSELANRDHEISRLKAELAASQKDPHSISVGDAETSESKETEARATKPEPETKSAANENQAKADDLTRIKGIGNVLASKLDGIGITKLEQIASLSQADVDRIKKQINSKGLGDPSNWIDQARSLMKGHQSKA